MNFLLIVPALLHEVSNRGKDKNNKNLLFSLRPSAIFIYQYKKMNDFVKKRHHLKFLCL